MNRNANNEYKCKLDQELLQAIQLAIDIIMW